MIAEGLPRAAAVSALLRPQRRSAPPTPRRRHRRARRPAIPESHRACRRRPAHRQPGTRLGEPRWLFWLIGSIVATGLHLWALYRPVGPSALPWLPDADKLGHVIVFGLPLLLILLAGASRRLALGRRPATRFVVITSALFVGHAVVSEWIQHRFYSERAGDPYDVLADWTGCTLALLGYALVDRRWTADVEAGQA